MMEDQPKPNNTPKYTGLTCSDCCFYGVDQENAAPGTVTRQAPCRRYPPTLSSFIVPAPAGGVQVGQAMGHVQVMRNAPACGECSLDVTGLDT
jgi:hypothetical protein